MSKNHLRYIGSGAILSHKIRSIRIDDSEDRVSGSRNYFYVKQRLRANSAQLASDITINQRLKLESIKSGDSTEEEIEQFYNPHLVIEGFGKIPIALVTALKTRYPSLEEKCYENFNRTLICCINEADLIRFQADMRTIGSYQPNEQLFHPGFSIFKYIQSFKYYSVYDRAVFGSDLQKGIIRLFPIQSSRKKEIMGNLSEDFDIAEISSCVFSISPKEGSKADKGYVIGRIASTFDDIQKIYDGLIEVDLTPLQERNEETIDISISTNNNVPQGLPLVGIIDSGIEYKPIWDNILDQSLSQSYVTGSSAISDAIDHGTGVASVVAFGDQIHTGSNILNVHAKVVSIKITALQESALDHSLIIEIVQSYHDQGIKIFNMSFNLLTPLKDNSAQSILGYTIDFLLAQDKYKDTLFFLSAGNITGQQLTRLEVLYNSTDTFRFDQDTNILPMADSTNAVVSGSINSDGHISSFSRKNKIDYCTALNTVNTPRELVITRDLNYYSKFNLKPDFLSLGENVRTLSSQIHRLTTIQRGTSFSSPMLCNIACRIRQKYPDLSANGIKALMLNCSSVNRIQLNSGSMNPMLLQQLIRDRNKCRRDRTIGTDSILQVKEIDGIKKRYFGFGEVDIDRCLNSYDHRVTMILEDDINLNYEKAYEITLPTNHNFFTGTGSYKIITSLNYNNIPIISDHLNYNPIHIGCRIIACTPQVYNDLRETIKTLDSKIRNGEGSATDHITLKSLKKELRDRVISPWTQDNYYSINYANSQSIGNNTSHTKKKLNARIGNKLYLQVRCNIKNTNPTTLLFKEIKDFILTTKGKIVENFEDLSQYYKPFFAIACTIEDLSSDSTNLYNAILVENEGNIVIESMDAVVEGEVDVNTINEVTIE